MASMLRLRTFILITGTLLCLLIAAAFVASGQWQYPAQAGKLCVYFWAGSVTILWDDPLIYVLAFDRHYSGLARWNTLDTDWELWVQFPLYAVLLAVAIPTLLVWRFVPKFPRGHSGRCGYNLTGLTEARCPECGEPFGECGIEMIGE